MISKASLRRLRTALLATLLLLCLASCGAKRPGRKDVVVLFTGDVHCGMDRGFGYAGVWQLREKLEAEGCATLLVDCGDSIQGEPVGMLTKGGAIVDLMGEMRYDAAVPGNHEFDYGVDRLLELAGTAAFPYVCCNLTTDGRGVFSPYIIKEAAGIRIAFVGITTPATITSSSPVYFQNGDGNYVYSFMQDLTGDPLYDAVQRAVDAARAEGAVYVYALAHLGRGRQYAPWSCEDVIAHTSGIDVFLDGHSHDTDILTIRNKDGKEVVRAAAGTKLECVGYSRISARDGSLDTGLWRWDGGTESGGQSASPQAQTAPHSASSQDAAVPQAKTENEMARKVRAVREKLDGLLGRELADLPYVLSAADSRRTESSLGDFCTDAMRKATGADIAIMNGGGIRADLGGGRITYADVLTAFPFGNSVSVISCTGRQVLDALEWSARMLPGSSGGFLQVSGLSYAVDLSVPHGCIADEQGMCIGIEGARRVHGVMVGGRPIEEDAVYTVAGPDYVLARKGDGMTAFDGAVLLRSEGGIDACVANALESLVPGGLALPSVRDRITLIGG
ncbi:MAG: bifunctional metallophosphatase/5'-nucleotidase [Treponema sp.]|nr:bifunctional metallophosphatase/5'-nucleotidase [Treponema sp.]